MVVENKAIAFRVAGDATIATLQDTEVPPQVFDLLLGKLAERRDAGGPVKFILDLSKLTFLGSVELSALVHFLKWVTEAKGRLALVGLTGQCLGVLEVTQLTKVFNLHPDVSSALEALRRSA